MHLLPLPLALLLLYLVPFLSAAPADLSNTPSQTGTSESPLSTPQDVGSASNRVSSTDQAQASTTPTSHADPPKVSHKPTTGATTKHRVVTSTKPGPIPGRPGNPIGNPTHSLPPAPSRTHIHPPSHPQPIAALVLEILGALAGFIFLLSLLRCIYSYNRTPARDRITAILHRHQLQREMEELERSPPDPRRSVEPPPPYLAPPPTYSPSEESPRTPQPDVSYSQETSGQLSPLRPNG